VSLPVVFAEVMDKEPSSTWLISCGLILAVLALVAVRLSRWSLAIFAPAALLSAVVLTSEICDPYVGPAILREAGLTYVVTGWISALLPFLACILGVLWSHRVQSARASTPLAGVPASK
jgi:hypothetical protein